MGNFCSTSWITKYFFKSRVKCGISNLLHKIIRNNWNTNTVTSDEKRLMDLMNVVRGLSDEWNHMINMSVTCDNIPSAVIKNIIDLMSNDQNSLFRIGNILCICTYVTDVCSLLSIENPDVCNIIDFLVEYILEKNFEMSVKFYFLFV